VMFLLPNIVYYISKNSNVETKVSFPVVLSIYGVHSKLYYALIQLSLSIHPPGQRSISYCGPNLRHKPGLQTDWCSKP
jgi:hypothetical protein